jgi:serine protease inhibitor
MFTRMAITLTAALLSMAQPALAAELAEANNEMGMDMLRRLDPGGSKNVFISPFSISSALTITANGARAGTLDAMRTALHLKQISLADADAKYKILNAAFNKQQTNQWQKSSKNPVELKVANGLFVQKGFALKQPFIDVAQKQFSATVDNIDFADPSASAFVNNWVSARTNKKIPKIVGKLSSDMRLIIANAVYFKAPWEHQFDEGITVPAAFNITAGNTIKIPMMHMDKFFRYAKMGAVEAVCLPYRASSLEMSVILPAKGSSVEQAMKAMTATFWSKLVDAQERDLELAMPKFKIEYSNSLKSALGQMGMKEAFSPGANFSGIADQGLFISDVLHKTYLDVNEKGTEAAAATVVEMMQSGEMHSTPTPFVVDRPFIVTIHDRDTKTIVFLGVVRDPRQ